MSPVWDMTARLAGVDEAGRGPLAGPVVAAAVILPARMLITGLDDSKKLTEQQRQRLSGEICMHAVAYGLGWADAAEIDAVNILGATFLAMRRALLALPVAPLHVRVDGNRAPSLAGLPFVCTLQTLVQGDRKDAAVAAASVLAKTWRDRWMVAADTRYPGYGFAAHKGYGTAQHVQALHALGPCLLHRKSFEPVRSIL